MLKTGCLEGGGEDKEVTGTREKEISGVMQVFYIFIVMWVTQMYPLSSCTVNIWTAQYM